MKTYGHVYTPGPWKARHDSESYYGIETANEGIGIGEAYGKGNADLIAAAPDLLAICIESLRYVDKEISPHFFKRIQAAINKAYGSRDLWEGL